MSINFNETYFTNGADGYPNYHDYPHFALRANWLVNLYNSLGFSNKIYVLGCAYGYLIKHCLDLDPTFPIYGVEFSQHAYDQSLAVGVQDRITLLDVNNFSFPADMEVCISWDFFDSIQSDVQAQAIIAKLADCKLQMHVICTDDGGQDAIDYANFGYFIRNITQWETWFEVDNKPAQEDLYLVEYHSRIVWHRNPTGWQEELHGIPLSGDRVSF